MNANLPLLCAADREPVAEHLPLAWTKSTAAERQVDAGKRLSVQSAPPVCTQTLTSYSPGPIRNLSSTWTTSRKSMAFSEDRRRAVE